MTTLLQTLSARHLLEASSSPELERHLEAPRTVYAGFDPTARSLQIGNFVTIMTLRHFQMQGHSPIAIVGGATGMIGDPSGKSTERPLLSRDDIAANMAGIKENLSRFLDFDDPKAPARIMNNADWFEGVSYIDFLRDVGKHFRMGAMLGKDSVKSRLSSEAGMSYTEFSYQLLQAYDFLVLHDRHACTIQLGGSDQWGNITAGIDLIRRLRGSEAFALTFPLACDSAGRKFGKSAGNAIYLNPEMTSYYDFFQYFMRVEDADVIRLLHIFTFLPLDEIAALEKTLTTDPDRRIPQHRLAEEVTRLVHGNAGLAAADKATQVLFGGDVEGLRADELLRVLGDVKSATVPAIEMMDQSVVDVAVRCGFLASKGEARRLIDNGGFYLNNIKVTDVARRITPADLIDNAVLLLRSGKKNYFLLHRG